MGGWTDGRLDGRAGWMDGSWMDSWINRCRWYKKWRADCGRGSRDDAQLYNELKQLDDGLQ